MSGSKQRLSKKEQRRLQVAREKRRRNLKIILPIVIVAFVFIGFGIFRLAQPEVDGVTRVASAPGADHDDTLQIPFGGLPPMGGPHASRWQTCGIYDTPVLPQNAIHSLEHGAVWITYHPDLSEADLAQLYEAVDGLPEVLLSPYPDQEAPVVLTVWDRQLVLESASDNRVDEFITRYRNRTGPEASASCEQGGIGTPIG